MRPNYCSECKGKRKKAGLVVIDKSRRKAHWFHDVKCLLRYYVGVG